MKLKLLKVKAISWFLLIIITLQSCTVYKKTPVTLSEALQSNKRVLVEMTNDKKMRLKRIERADSIYYGIQTAKGREFKVALHENEIKRIKVKDSGTSTFLTIGAITLTLGIVIIALLINDLNNTLNDSFGESGN
jgi:hypothetical protein